MNTEILLTTPFKVKTGVLAMGDDYSGLFLSKQYILNFPDKNIVEKEVVNNEKKNLFDLIKSLQNEILSDIWKYKKIFLENPEVIVDYGETNEKQVIRDFVFTNKSGNNSKRIETGFVSFGEVEGCFIRGDNLFGSYITSLDEYSDELNEKIVQLNVWKDLSIDR